MARSTFSTLGLPIGDNNLNMSYLYGISDFFSVMFKDSDRVNTLLEAESESCSEVYSRFLQLTANISLTDIQKTCGQTLEMITLSSSDAVFGQTNLYNLPKKVVSSRYIANLPLLPSTLLEEDVDYRFEQTSDGIYRIRFAKDIFSAGFSTRLSSDGTTKEYALWFVDSEIDELWIATHFGNLAGISPQASTDTFKNFVYGLYYLYLHGPALDLIRKGLNLALGLPLCRGSETVLEIRKYLETDQYIVITDQNQYVIPYGLSPIVSVGQQLSITDEISRWVEVKDYINDGNWWINLEIPEKFIPSLPLGQPDRYATANSHFDYLMRNYLKKHTFLVNVKVTSFENNQIFQQLSDIIKKAKPSYTEYIYIWSVEQSDTLTIDDDSLPIRLDQFRCENLSVPIARFYRGNTTDAILRGCPTFNRFNIPNFVTKLCGTDTYTNGNPDVVIGGSVTGYANGVTQFRPNTTTERAWLRTILDRGSEVVTGSRGSVGFYRGINSAHDSDFNYAGVPVKTTFELGKVVNTQRIIPLYLTTQTDIKNKCNAIGVRVPDLTEWTFDFLNPAVVTKEIDGLGINEGVVDAAVLLLSNNFNLAFFRGSNVKYLSNVIPDSSFQTWAPPDSSYLTSHDYILGIRVYDQVVGMYWVTSNFTVQPNWYFPVADTDSLKISLTNRPTRGLGPMGAPYYMLRGRGTIGYNTTGLDINGRPINDAGTDASTIVHNDYSDTLNGTPVTITRTGTSLNHTMVIN